jgi:hypothetical protein
MENKTTTTTTTRRWQAAADAHAALAAWAALAAQDVGSDETRAALVAAQRGLAAQGDALATLVAGRRM